jgi:L-2,4-diaminobutyric acid acetyltransferase
MLEQLVETPISQQLELTLRTPALEDGQSMWRMARDSNVLDLNSSYSYILWCRDFAATSIMADVDGRPAGFITGYLRPDEPGTLMIWQVAVDEAYRGQRIAGTMLDALASRTGARRVETTITDDNEASMRLFQGFAARRNTGLDRSPLILDTMFPDGHDTEFLFRIGPLG